MTRDRLREYAVRASGASGFDECEDIIRDAVNEGAEPLRVALAEALHRGSLGCLYRGDIERLRGILRKAGG